MRVQAALEQHDWNLQPAADQLLAQRESEVRFAFSNPSPGASTADANGNGDSPVPPLCPVGRRSLCSGHAQ